jgi:hypothetical protein
MLYPTAVPQYLYITPAATTAVHHWQEYSVNFIMSVGVHCSVCVKKQGSYVAVW